MNVFITGIAGFLGSHLADRFENVTGNDNLLCGTLDNVNHESYYEDCRNYQGMLEILEGSDVLYHCAATAYEGLSVFSPSLVTQNVYEASVATFSAAIEAGVKRIVFCSSMARYGSQGYPFTEDLPTMPCDPYGIAKAASEQTLQVLCEQHNVEYVIAVPHNIIGPRQKYNDPFRNVASIMTNRMLHGDQPIIYGDGNQKRCFSYIDDVLECLVKMTDIPSGEIVNIGPDEQFITINELAREIADILDFDLEPIYVPGRPCEVRYATCSSDKARKILGYETKTPLREGLEGLVDYIKESPDKDFDYSFYLEITRGAPRTWTDQLI